MKPVNARRRALNLPEVGDSYLGHLEHAPDLVVALFPSWYGPAMPDWPQALLQDDFQLFEVAAHQDAFSPELAAFLAAGDKPLVFTAGTGNLHAAKFFTCALAAAAKLGRRAIFLSKDEAQVPAHLPATVLWQAYAPMSRLLGHAVALIHHGGIGTTAEALRAGTPQVVVPFGWDQFDNGARVASLGVGAVLQQRPLRANKLARTLDALMASQEVHVRCAQVAAKFSPQYDPRALCLEIERRLAA